jgi:hypothetical protein
MIPNYIVGDSFGKGEFILANEEDKVDNVHPGCEIYLQQNLDCPVINYSKEGASNQDILEQISDNNIKNATVIVFATDSFRKIKNNHKLATHLFVKKQHTIKEIHEILFLEWVKKLETITKTRNCNVYLIGGYANIYESYAPAKHIKILTHSWISDILNKQVGDLSAIFYKDMEYLLTLNPNPTNEQKADFIAIAGEKAFRLHHTKNHSSFLDNYHPDRTAHQTLSKKIIKSLDIL